MTVEQRLEALEKEMADLKRQQGIQSTMMKISAVSTEEIEKFLSDSSNKLSDYLAGQMRDKTMTDQIKKPPERELVKHRLTSMFEEMEDNILNIPMAKIESIEIAISSLPDDGCGKTCIRIVCNN